ncbi:MAG: sulfotransferase [Candidatus Binatia bacterium]
MRPIFIGGCERSGTTLLGAMLGSHSSCLCVPEMKFKMEMLQFADNGVNGSVEPASRVEKLARRSSFRIWGLSLNEIIAPSRTLAGRELIEWTVLAYGQKMGKTAPAIWIDHTPANIKYAWTLFQAFPDAHLIHIIRDGRAVAASLLPLDWGPNEIDSAARYWAAALAYGLATEAAWPERVIQVRYENLVEEPTTTLKRLCAALSLSYEPAMCQGTGFQVPPYTAKQHALVGTLPEPTRITAWERQLTARQIEIFESITADLLKMLRYEPKFGFHAKRMSRLEILSSSIREFYKKEFVNRHRKRRRRRETLPS